jgi:hypothetical protein
MSSKKEFIPGPNINKNLIVRCPAATRQGGEEEKFIDNIALTVMAWNGESWF